MTSSDARKGAQRDFCHPEGGGGGLSPKCPRTGLSILLMIRLI